MATRKKMARRRPPTAGSPVPAGLHFLPSPLTEIPDHLLAEILLRLPATADLARASAICVSFRRLVTDRSFIRRFRRLHAPPLLGFLDRGGFNPALPPHPSAPAARALALAADFSFSFLPSHCRWDVQDIRDGRVLLHRLPERGEQLPRARELVVCDPLHRRYVLLPPAPDDLTASVQHPDSMVRTPQCKPFLVPLDEEEAAAMEDTSFRVISMVHCKIKLSAIVFSSSTGQWTAAASEAWGDLFRGNAELGIISQMHTLFLRRHYAYGCFYWDCLLYNSKKLLVLDTRRMEFSMADLPPGDWFPRGLAIVEAGEGRLGMFGFHDATVSDLSYTIAQNKGKSPSQWQIEKRILQDSENSGYIYDIKDAAERYLLLGRREISPIDNPLNEYFSMDIKTLQLQSFSARRYRLMFGTQIYTNLPPSVLSSPTI